MCSENIYIAGRYNKFMRNLSQSPWIDKDDVRIKQSVQELIEDGLKKYLQFDKSVFSSSGREDVDVRMLGKGRPFIFRIVNPWYPDNYNKETMKQIQEFVNDLHGKKIQIRNLQVVTKDCVAKNLKDGEESKTKEYRALCCCTKRITDEDIQRIGKITDLCINQKTPIRVLHRRSLAVRRRTIHRLRIERVELGEFDSVTAADLNQVFSLTLLTEAGTYIKEFVHGDFGRTEPSLSTLIGDCDTDLMELDVMEVYLDWPPSLDFIDVRESSTDVGLPNFEQMSDKMATSEKNLPELYKQALKAMLDAESMPRGDARQSAYIKARYLFEQAMELVETLSLFSDNETIEDVTTMDLKYILIPAYLAKLTISAECGTNRLETFTRADYFTKRFFQRVLKYGLGNEAIEQAIKSDEFTASTTDSSLEAAMQSRLEKIEKYKKMKLLEGRLEELERRVSSGKEVDDEIAREYYLNLVKKWINDTLESYEREVKPALFFERNRPTSLDEDILAPGPSFSSIKPKTITIVKNELQKQVFGLGYPSRPTVTVDEFISKKIKDGDLAFQTQKEIYGNSLQRYAEQPDLRREQEENSDAERDEKEDRDDSEELSKKRRWDEFKDDNPRGSGNRHNMG